MYKFLPAYVEKHVFRVCGSGIRRDWVPKNDER